MPFGIILHEIESIDDDLVRRISGFVDALIDKYGYPACGLGLSMIVGNYGYTPFGIHKDEQFDGLIHLCLGPGIKHVHYWRNSDYVTANGSEEGTCEVDSVLYSASSYRLEPSDVFYLPAGNDFHIGEATELSVSVIICLEAIS